MDEAAELFDQLLAQSRSRVATEASPQSSRAARLPLQGKPCRTWQKEVHREIAAVDPTLLQAFRELVSGKMEWPLFLHGEPGTGKTCAALALLDYLLPWQGVFIEVPELVNRRMATFGTKEQFDWTPFGRYRDANEGERHPSPSGKSGSLLVVLDELGARDKVHDTHYECVKKVLDMRDHLPLILISNLDIGDIEKLYDARIASRCEAGRKVTLGGHDRRVNP